MNHPTEFDLSRFVDDDLPPAALQRIEQHLAVCDDCRLTVNEYRELGSLARETELPPVPDVVEEVLRRRAAGERVRLVTPEHERRSGSWGRLRVAAAAVVAFVAAGVAFSVFAPQATATRSELSIVPELPAPGEMVEFVYRPATFLAGEDSLRLRARARKSHDPPPRGVIGGLREAVLHRQANGSFTGRFRIEPDDVYLVAAVEDIRGSNVDTNFGSFWDVFVADSGGRPSIAALEARYRILEDYNFVLATGWAGEVTEEFPESPLGWTLLLVHEQAIYGDPLPAGRLAFHGSKFEELTRNLSGASESQLRWLGIYARRLGRTGDFETLMARLAELDPTDRTVLDHRVAFDWREGLSPAARLAYLEDLWRETGTSTEFLIGSALTAAVQAGDTTAVRRWLTRNEDAGWLDRPAVAEELARIAGFENDGVRLLTEAIDSLRVNDEQLRRLQDSRDQHEAKQRLKVAELQLHLAGLLRRQGDSGGALARFDSAAAVVWKPEELDPYLPLLVAQGRGSDAAEIVARMAAVPLVDGILLERWEHLLPSDSARRVALLAAGRTKLRDLVISTLPTPRPIAGNPEVETAQGDLVPIRSLVGPDGAVFMQWDRTMTRNPDSVMRGVDLSDETLESIETVQVIHEPVSSLVPSPIVIPEIQGVTVVLERGLQVSDALNDFTIPSFVAVDGSHRVRARASDLLTAARIAVILSR